jgi:sugar lactone lactonase YvrE
VPGLLLLPKIFKKKMVSVLLLILALLAGCLCLSPPDLSLIVGASRVTFDFPSQSDSDQFEATKGYTACIVTGVKVDLLGRYIVTLPRWRASPSGARCPVTLGVLDVSGSSGSSLMIRAFPDWVSQGRLVSVLGVETDRKGRLFVLDQGRENGGPVAAFAARLVVYDLLADPTGGTVFLDLPFGPTIAPTETAFLNDIVVDSDRDYAFITDSGIPTVPGRPSRGGLVVVNLQGRVARRVLDSHRCVQPEVSAVVGGIEVVANVGADSLAMSPDFGTLFFAALSSRTLYTLPTSALRNFSGKDEDLVPLLRSWDKGTLSDGFAVDNMGQLFISALEGDGVWGGPIPAMPLVSSDGGFALPPAVVATEGFLTEWPDTFGFDNSGRLVFTVNHLSRFLNGTMIFDGPQAPQNLGLYAAKTGTMGYGWPAGQAPTVGNDTASLRGPFAPLQFTAFGDPSSTTHWLIADALGKPFLYSLAAATAEEAAVALRASNFSTSAEGVTAVLRNPNSKELLGFSQGPEAHRGFVQRYLALAATAIPATPAPAPEGTTWDPPPTPASLAPEIAGSPTPPPPAPRRKRLKRKAALIVVAVTLAFVSLVVVPVAVFKVVNGRRKRAEQLSGFQRMDE